MPNDYLKQTLDATNRMVDEKNRKKLEADRNFIVSQVGKDLKEALVPTLQALAQDSANVARAGIKAMSEAKMPDVVMPSVHVPTPQIDVNVDLSSLKIPEPRIEVNPLIKFPDIKFPEVQQVEGFVKLMGVSLEKPLPVTLRNADGSPTNLLENLQTVIGGSGGGFRHVIVDKMPSIAISNGTNTSVTLVNADGANYDYDHPFMVTVENGGFNAYLRALDSNDGQVSIRAGAGETNSNTLRVVQATDAVSSVNIVSGTITGSSGTLTVDQLSGANWSVSVASQPITFDIKQVSGSIDSVSIVSNIAALDVLQVSGSVFSVNVVSDAIVLDQTTDSIAVRQVSGFSDSVNVVNANTLDVQLVSGSVASVNVLQFNGTAPATGLNETNAGVLRTVLMTDSVSSVVVNSGTLTGITNTLIVDQVSGANWSVNLVSQPSTFDVKQVSGSIDSVSIVSNIASLDVQLVSGSVASVNVVQFNGSTPTSGLNETTAGTLRTIQMTDSVSSVNIVSSVSLTTTLSGSLTSSVATGPSALAVVDDGSAPLQTGGLVRTANPTAIAAGGVIKSSYDDLGRQLIRPVQVRDLIATAYVAKATGSTFGTETTLLAAAAGFMYDLIYVLGTNDSTASINLDLRGVTAGNVLFTATIPAGGSAGISLPVPLPQTTSDTGNNWTIDLPDVTGTNVTVSALFTKEV